MSSSIGRSSRTRWAKTFSRHFSQPAAANSIRSCSSSKGSIPNEKIAGDGYFSGFGNKPGYDQPMTFSDWIDLLAPKALAGLAAGTCATYGGIHAMAGNPTGAMGILDYLGCNVPKRGWMGGVGGCPNVGGICIGCTMPGFPDKFMPFMDEPPGAKVSSTIISLYGNAVRTLRGFTQTTVDKEPKWRQKARSLRRAINRAATVSSARSLSSAAARGPTPV
jgi:hypothetical protein